MGVQPPAKTKRDSKMDQLEKQIRKLQTQFDELKRGNEADDEHDEACLPRVGRGGRSSRPQHGAKGRHVLEPESDDDEEVPIKLETMWATQAAKQKQALEISTGRKRKHDIDAPGLPDLDDDDLLVRPKNRRVEREAERVASRPAGSKRARLYCDSEEEDSPPSVPRKHHRGQPAYPASIDPSFRKPSTPKPKPVRLAPIFVPGSKKPLPKSQWATPPAKRAAGFTLPTSSKEIEGILAQKAKTPAASRRSARQSDRKASSKLSSRDQSEDKDSTSASEPSYVEVEPFDFKAVISYVEGSAKDIDTYFHSTDLADRMQGLWSQVKQLSKQWEDAAGTDWAWELQRQSGGRLCVSSKLAKQSTKWRAGDNGYYACNTCTSRARLCFTWAADEEGKFQEGFAIPIPKGDFLCLPVHPDDRSGVEVARGRELRYWLNESDDSESDSSGEDVGEGSSEFDGDKTESDFDHLSDSESSTSEDAS
jgi:hypothetical protein